MNKWPKHIEECIKASLEHGPDAKFTHPDRTNLANIDWVMVQPHLNWRYGPPKPLYIEQWGNEYEYLNNTFWYPSKNKADGAASLNRVALQYRRIDPETGKTLHFETLEVFK